MPSETERRLAQLAALDPVSAGQIRPHLPVTDLPPPAPALESPAEQMARWPAEAPDIVILLGAAGGEELAAILRDLPDMCQCLLIEYDLAQAARLFTEWPLEDHLRTGRLALAFGTDEEHVENRFLALLDIKRAPAVRLLEMTAAPAAAARFYQAALARAQKTVHLNLFNLGTLVYRGPLWQHNTIRNLPRILAHPGVQALDDAFAGRPAVVVGAGPSLNDVLPVLAEHARRFVVISTGTALRALRRANIRPDLVVSVDASHLTGAQFTVDCSDLYLACSLLAFPPVLTRFKGLFGSSMNANPISRWLAALGAPKGELIAAGTVTTTAIDLAVRMGCGPVIVVGADLSFADDGTTHADHTMYHGRRLDPERLVRVPGNYQAEVRTTEQFRCYIELLQDYVRNHPAVRFINATTRGARIEGLELVRPGALAARGSAPFDAYAVIAARHAAFTDDVRADAAAALARIADELAEIQNDARRAAMLCNQLIMLLRAPHAGDEAVGREYLETLRQIDARLTAGGASAMFLDMSLWPIGYKSGVKRERHEEHFSDALLANRRSRELYEQIAGAARWTGQLVRAVIGELESDRPGVAASRDDAGPPAVARLELADLAV